MNIQTPTSASWTEYFITFDIDNKKVNEHTDSILDISSLSDDIISKINNFTSSKGDPILMYYSMVLSSIEFLHNISDISSTNWSRQPVLVALNGCISICTILVIIELDSLFDVTETDAPTLTLLLSVVDQEFFDSTVAPDTHPQQFHHLLSILLPPFLWKTACDLKDGSPGSVFLAFLKCINKFIEANEDGETLNGVSQRTCSNVYTFLWASSKEKVSSISIILAVDNTTFDQWTHTRHPQCLAPQEQLGVQQPHIHHHGFHQIAEAIKLQSASILASQSDKMKKGFNKLDSAMRTLIQNASSTNREIASGAVTDTCLDFFKQSSHGNVRLHFICTLKHIYKAQTEVCVNTWNNSCHCLHQLLFLDKVLQ